MISHTWSWLWNENGEVAKQALNLFSTACSRAWLPSRHRRINGGWHSHLGQREGSYQKWCGWIPILYLIQTLKAWRRKTPSLKLPNTYQSISSSRVECRGCVWNPLLGVEGWWILKFRGLIVPLSFLQHLFLAQMDVTKDSTAQLVLDPQNIEFLEIAPNSDRQRWQSRTLHLNK